MPEQQTSYEDAFLKKEDWSEGIKDKAAPLRIKEKITLYTTNSNNSYAYDIKVNLKKATTRINGSVLNMQQVSKLIDCIWI